jgi:hypothetical protein
LCLDGDRYTAREKEKILENALHLFATHKGRIAFNEENMIETAATNNPLAIITSTDKSPIKGKTVTRNCLNEAVDLKKTMLCRDAMVEICHRNINPKWGLFNGAIGKVIDLNYAEDNTPNSGDLPRHVVVEFKKYCGPVWDKTTPFHVPIERHFFF